MRLLASLATLLLALGAASPILAAGFDPEQLAAELEALASDAPRTAAAPETLAEAAILRLRLGQIDRAAADARALDRAWGNTRPDLVARVTLARARHLAELEAWGDLRALLTAAVPALDRRASLDDRLEARALLGRALVHLGRAEEAAARHRLTVVLAKGAELSERGADAVGDALFRLAEVEREKADRVVLAPYAGKGERGDILRYINGPVARWLVRKREALDAAERAYLRAFDIELPPPPPPPRDPDVPVAPWGLHVDNPFDDPDYTRPVPSPRWAIAATARVALGWGALSTTLRSVPVPRVWPSCEDLGINCCYDDYDRHRLRAKRACEFALRLGLQHHIADEHTRACEVWLSRNYAAEWKLVDELPPKITPPLAAGPFAPVPRSP